MNWFFLLIFLVLIQKVQSESFKCYECMGVDIPGNQKLEDFAKKNLKKSLKDLMPIENDQCLATPRSQDAVECQTLCMSMSGIANLENYGGPADEGFVDEETGEVYNFTLDDVRNLKSPKIAVRTCFDTVLKQTNLTEMQQFLNVFPSGTDCIRMSLDIVGVSSEVEACACPTDFCNNKPVKDQLTAGHPVEEIDVEDFTEECPSPLAKLNEVCHNNCTMDSQCNPGKKCCTEPCGGHQCKNIVNARSFSPYSCTQATFSSSKLEEFVDKVKDGMKDTDEDHTIPETTVTCEKQPAATTENCKTFGIHSDAELSLDTYYGPDLPEEMMMEILQMKSINDLGTSKATLRGCLDEMIPEVLQHGFPQIPQGKYCGSLEGMLLGAKFSTGVCVCNSDRCNGVASITKTPGEPVNGGWSEWVRHKDCRYDCDLRGQSNIRYCNKPVPENGGELCTASDGQKQVSKEEDWEKCSCVGGKPMIDPPTGNNNQLRNDNNSPGGSPEEDDENGGSCINIFSMFVVIFVACILFN